MRRHLPVLLIATSLGSCALLDAPVQIADPTTGEMLEVPLGDAIADNSESVADALGSAVGTVNPILGLMAAGAIGTLLAGARRKKKQPPS